MKLIRASGTCSSCGEYCKAQASTEDDAEAIMRHNHYWDSGDRRCLFAGHVSFSTVRVDDDPTSRRTEHDKSVVHPPPKKKRWGE